MMPSTLRPAVVLAIVVVTGGEAVDGRAIEPQAKDDKKSEKRGDKETILGTWKVVGVEADGKDASETPEGREHKGVIVTITRDKAVFRKANETNETMEFTYHLDTDSKPKTIDLEDENTRIFNCVYSLDGDTLKICMPRRSGEKRPAEVATREGSESGLLVLKREMKDEAKNQ